MIAMVMTFSGILIGRILEAVMSLHISYVEGVVV